MYTVLVIGAALFIVIGLTFGLSLLLHDEEPEEPVHVEHPPIVPVRLYDWETVERGPRSPA